MQPHAGTPSVASDRGSRSSERSGVCPQSTLDLYFHDAAHVPRLTPSKELAAAIELGRLRRVLWQTLLREPKKRRWVLAVACRQLQPDRIPPLIERSLSSVDIDELVEVMTTADRECTGARAVVSALRGQPGSARLAEACERAEQELRRARDAFVNANLGLVVMVARRYERGHLNLGDLIQEGNTGLLKAVDRFDPERGFRFSTYAVWWIRHAIGRALSDKSREIRVPVHVAERQQTLMRTRADFERRNGRDPTARELADATGWPLHKVEDLLTVEYRRAFTRDGDTGRVVPVNPDSLLEDVTEPDLDAPVLGRYLRDAMEDLSPIQRDVLRRRFGLGGTEPMTLREVGEIHALSRERIRQIQDRALRDLERKFAQAGLLEAS